MINERSVHEAKGIWAIDLREDMYTVVLTYYNYFHTRKLYEHVAGFANIDEKMKPKQIMDTLTLLNPKTVYR